MNQAELELITGWFSSYTDLKDRMKNIQDQFNIQKLVDEKYSTWDWNFGYSPTYNFRKQVKTANGGHIEMNLQVEAGIMTGDLLLVADRNPQNRKVNTGVFIDAIAANLQKKLYA